MNNIIIIPARWDSSRFPGKPLVNILGKTLIQRVWLQCVKAFDSSKVYIATDDRRIRNHCEENGMQYIMTTNDCLTGTDRVAQAYKKLGERHEVVINVQGDEPLVKPEDILKVAGAHSKAANVVCCGTCKVETEEEFRNPNIVKIVKDYNETLLYASRAGIPTNKNLEFEWAYRQVCIYAFSSLALSEFSTTDKTPLESVEDIEFLRFLDLGYRIEMIEVSDSSVAVDIPDDVEKVENILKRIGE
jgi:3-deoxy-manno-octulosonate cytidylyltransferase (CMP-KDO synthetase)